MTKPRSLSEVLTLAQRRGFLRAIAEFVNRYDALETPALILKRDGYSRRDLAGNWLEPRYRQALLKVLPAAEIVSLKGCSR